MWRSHASADRPKRVAIFNSVLVGAGGAERLSFEEAVHLRAQGFNTVIVTTHFDPAVRFGGAYDLPINVARGASRRGRLARFAATTLGLWRWLRTARPDLVIASSVTDCALLRVPATLSRTPYVTHIHGSVFWFATDLSKYSILHRGALRRVLDASPFHGAFVPRKTRARLPTRLRLEAQAFAYRLGARGARLRLTLSRRTAWEVQELYGVPAQALKGAFPASIFSRRPRGDPLARFRRGSGPVVLNVNRLEPRKRVELAVRAFAEVLRTRPTARLVIGGTGPSAAELRTLVGALGLTDHVHFAGFVPEAELWDWLAACEVFIHPNWAEFAIAPYEALALGTKVVWSTEMESDPAVDQTGLVYAADPTVPAMAEQLRRALDAPRPGPEARTPMAEYTWERYFAAIGEIVRAQLATRS